MAQLLLYAVYGFCLLRKRNTLCIKGEEIMRSKITAVLSALFLAALTLTLTVAAEASPLFLDVTGSLDGATVLTTPGGGTAALGVDTLFSYHAIFESTGGTNMGPGGYYLYSATTTFDLSGHGTYTSSSLVVLLADPTSIYFPGSYLTGIMDVGTGDGLGAKNSTASPSFSMGAPIPSLLSNSLPGMASGTINFDSGVSLSNLTWGSAIQTAEFTAATAVPEPSTYALLCISLGVVGFARKKMVSKDSE